MSALLLAFLQHGGGQNGNPDGGSRIPQPVESASAVTNPGVQGASASSSARAASTDTEANAPSLAEDERTGSIFGTIRSSLGELEFVAEWISPWQIACLGEAGVVSATIDKDTGDFRSEELAPGSWRLHASGVHHQSQVVEFDLSEGEEKRIDILMRPVRQVLVRVTGMEGGEVGHSLTPGLESKGLESVIEVYENSTLVAEVPYDWRVGLSFYGSPAPPTVGVEEFERLGWSATPLEFTPYRFLSPSHPALASNREEHHEAQPFGAVSFPSSKGPYLSLAITGGEILETVRLEDAGQEASFSLNRATLFSSSSSVSFCLPRAISQWGEEVLDMEFNWERGRVAFRGRPAGCYQIVGIPSGRIRFCFSAAGFAPLPYERFLAPRATVELGTLPLSRAVEIRGRVVDPSGAPVAGALVAGWREASAGEKQRQPIGLYGGVRTDASGSFRFETLPGPVWLHVLRGATAVGNSLGSASEYLVVTDSAAPPVELVARPTLEVTVVRHESFPDSSELRLVDSLGTPMTDRRWDDRSWMSLRVPPGDYTARVTTFDGLEIARARVVLDGTQRVITFEG